MAGNKEELEIEIDETGQLKIHVIGVKGKSCVPLAEEIALVVGKIIDKQYTSEFYQPGPDVRISDSTKTKIR